MPDEPEILRDLVTPVQPVRRPGNDRSRGVREGLALAVILVFAALGAGILAVPRLPPGASPGTSAIALASSSVAPASAAPSPSLPAPTPGVKPTAAVTPTRPCGTQIPEGLIYAKLVTTQQWVGATLADRWMAQPLPPSLDWEPEGPEIQPGTPVVLSIDYHACALAWSITLDGKPVSIQDNPIHDPAFAAQNYFILTLPPVRDANPRLRAELLFSRGWEGFEWTLHLNPPPIPSAFFSSLDQTVDGAPGCGFAVTLPGGSATVDECATTIPGDGAGPYWLWMSPGASVAFRVPNATFVPADVNPVGCGNVSGVPPDFHVDTACQLEPIYDPSNALTFRAPHTRGVWWIEVSGCASRGGSSACGIWFAVVDTADPMPTEGPIGN